MSVSDTVRHESNRVIFEQYVVNGFNFRMTDIQAAVGIVQLDRLDSLIAERRRIAENYGKRFSGIEGVHPVSLSPRLLPNWQSYPVRITDLDADRQSALMQAMLDRGVATRRGIMNAHQEPAYRGTNWRLPCSEAARNETILLPVFSGLSDSDQDQVAEALTASVRQVRR
jgi:dTDP-4-amino-4,6-dideoxygalactose transaminase